MEAAIESAAQQTAQDLHLLLDEAKPSHPPADPTPTPLGKENMATPAAGMVKKSNRGPLSAAQPSMPAGCSLSVHASLRFALQLSALMARTCVGFYLLWANFEAQCCTQRC